MGVGSWNRSRGQPIGNSIRQSSGPLYHITSRRVHIIKIASHTSTRLLLAQITYRDDNLSSSLAPLSIYSRSILRRMSGRLIAIGDIHGCSKALDAILAAIMPQADDTVVALGDYVDRGPDSKGVIDRLIELGTKCQLIALHGNHEEMMLDVIHNNQPPYRWLQYGGVETLDSYRFAGDMSVIPQEHRDFFASLRDFYETEEFFFVHANYDPDLPLPEQPRQLLRWLKLTEIIPLTKMASVPWSDIPMIVTEKSLISGI